LRCTNDSDSSWQLQIAGLTHQAAERMAVSSVQNVLDFFAGRFDSDLIVNKGF
jgi:D-3-phosphoglycerate dehydrogenase